MKTIIIIIIIIFIVIKIFKNVDTKKYELIINEDFAKIPKEYQLYRRKRNISLRPFKGAEYIYCIKNFTKNEIFVCEVDDCAGAYGPWSTGSFRIYKAENNEEIRIKDIPYDN